jgi:Zn-dependent protease with chaperone function
MIRLALLPQSMFVLSLLLTYLVHSTLWFLVAWAASHPGLGLSSAARSRVWRAALVGPLLGTVLALAVADGWRSPALELTLARSPAAAEPAVVAVPTLPALIDLDPEAPLPGAVRSPMPVAVLPGPAPASPPPLDLGVLLLAAIVATAGCRLAILGVRHLRFWRRLRGRRTVHTGAAWERLRELAAAAGLPFPVRLSISPLARGPMALGREEICLPARALDDLPGPALSAVLAHELAHLERRDNAWLTAGAVIEALLFFQPLTRLARRQLSAAAELACDEWAVELTESPVDLARSIAIVADWQLGRQEAVPVSAMARTPLDGDVVDRVKRLLAEPLPGTAGGTAGRSRLVFAVLVACGLVAPAIGGPGELQAAGVPMPLPKATQAANRFQVPPALEDDFDRQWDWDDEKRPRRPVRVRIPRVARPPRPPMPPMAPMPPMPPLPPMPASGADVGAVAAKMAELGMKLAELHASRAGETFTEADQAKVKEVERQMEELRKQLEVAEQRFSRDMEVWGNQYELRFGKDFERRMAEWGRAYAQRMEEWQKRHGHELQRWSRDLAWRTDDSRRQWGEQMRKRGEELRQRHEERRRQHEQRRKQHEERRKRQEEVRKQFELGRKQYELQRREQERQQQKPPR